MPSRFRKSLAITAGAGTNVYTAPAGGADVTLVQVANVDGANAADVSLTVTSSGGASVKLAHLVSVQARDSVTLIGGGLVLLPGDVLNFLASADNDLTATVCGFEGL